MKFIALLSIVLFSLSTLASKQMIDTSKSQLKWTGEKVTGKHHGTIKVKSGYMNLKEGVGEVVVDMNSIDVTDLEGKWKTKLMGHLRDDDFFSVKKYKTAKLEIKSVKQASSDSYKATGQLTIKGTTQPVNFDVKKSGDKYSGKLTFDRTKFGIKYNSGNFFENLGDKMIYDIVTLDFEVGLK